MSAVKNAVIAVAGMGRRFGSGKPKCLAKVQGKAILEYQLELLKDFENVFVVTGFGENDVMDFASKIRKDIIFVRNEDYQNTKTLESFYRAAKIIKGYAVFMDGDMIIEPRSFQKFLEMSADQPEGSLTFAVSKRITGEPVYADVTEEKDGTLTVHGFSYEKKSAYEWANIVNMPANLMESGTSNAFEHLTKFLPAAAEVIDRLEIDTPADLELAEREVKNLFL